MRKMNILVFDEVVVGTTAVYTSPTFNEQMGSVDRWCIHAIADTVSGSTPILTVQGQHSGDGGVNWKDKSATAEINGVTLSTSATNSNIGTDAGSTPSAGQLRLKITLGTTSPQAHVKIWFTGRDDG